MPQITEFGDAAYKLFDEADSRINICDGSVRSGKTIASLVKWIIEVKTAPPGEILMIGKTERTLKRNCFDVISEWLPNKRDFHVLKGTGEGYLGGRRFYYSGANDERAEEKIRGLTLIRAYGDEITTWPETLFKQCMLRLSLPGAKFYGTTNPDSPHHYLYEEYLKREGEIDLTRVKFSLFDNPGLPPEYIENIKKEYTGLYHKRFIQGLWVAAEGVVFDMWDEDSMVVDLLPEMVEVWISGDYGTNHATVFHLLGLGVDGVCYVLREYYHNGSKEGQKAPVEYSYDFRKFMGASYPQAIYLDPSAEAFAAQLRADKVRRIRNAENDVKYGIEVISSLMSLGLFKVHRSCNALISELTTYHWDATASKRGIDKPAKINDDAVDSMRYGVASRATLWRQFLSFVIDRRRSEEDDEDAA